MSRNELDKLTVATTHALLSVLPDIGRADARWATVHQALWVVKGTRVAIPRPRIHFRLQGRD